ncbi:hypothetical protein ACSBOB_29650 [Mesorhizobium sp. ASY16-5R]|uniref:hypothetical protein n=1 Tax=Mesorhizobium sp. ASY16-5R TaxID=3445772 RepID=UPI003FA0B981
MGYRFDPIPGSADEITNTLQNWVLGKGFQDLTRGIRETLEEAMLYLDVFRWGGGKTTMAAYEAMVASHRANAQKLNFPVLLAEVNKGLTQPMTFAEEFSSLQKARNCLEHRTGVVGPKDVDPVTGMLTLSFPRIRVFYKRGGEEVELALGEILDTHEVDDETAATGTSLYLGRATRLRQYALGEKLLVSPPDFYEISMACHLFAVDVASKLPTAPPAGASTTIGQPDREAGPGVVE